MDLRSTSEEEAFREEVRAFLLIDHQLSDEDHHSSRLAAIGRVA